MPITPNFSISATSDAGTHTITDTSTGSDVGLTSRKIYLYTVANELLQAAITWDYAESAYDISLEYDIALNVRIEWLTGSTVSYSKEIIHAFTEYGEDFYYNLTQDQSANPEKLRDYDYYKNKMMFRVELDSATQAIDQGSDLFSAQKPIDRYRYMMQKSNLFF
jgi:hypothetical protein